MKVAVVGTGYVGMSLAVLLAGNQIVTAIDIDEKKVELVNHLKSPIQDEYITRYLIEAKAGRRTLTLTAVENKKGAFDYNPADRVLKESDFVIIAVPTNYNPVTGHFDTFAVESVIRQVLESGSKAWIVIKSTVPIDFTDAMKEKFRTDHILFSPEFLREGKALYDNLYPSRIIIGSDLLNGDASTAAGIFAWMLTEGAEKKDIPVLQMGCTEAEAVKLFANTYLAMRVAYFNELDTFAETKNLDVQSLIRGVSLDPRIGDWYNHPGFGYGGYCLPKDTKQLLAEYDRIPEDLMRAVVNSNTTREKYIARRAMQIAQKEHPVIGAYRLTMKRGSDNCRQAAMLDVAEYLREMGATVIAYEPTLPPNSTLRGCRIVESLEELKTMSDCILANRYDSCLNDVKDKVYTRDVDFADDGLD